MDTELSLHYTLTQDADEHANDDSVDNDNAADNDEVDDGYFDPFALNDNNKKFGEIISIKKDNDGDDKQAEDEEDGGDDKQEEQEKEEKVENDENDKKDEEDGDEHGDEDDEDDEDEVEDEEDMDLLKELEESWTKHEKDKNESMSNLLQIIKNKNKSPHLQKHPKAKKLNHIIPKINPFVFDGNLKITLPANTQCEDKNVNHKKLHFHPLNTFNKRRKMKNELKGKLSKKRKIEMRKHRKEFGKEQDYIYKEKEEEVEIEDIEEEEAEEEEVEEPEEEEEEAADIEECTDAIQYISNIVEDGDELDEEDIARAALMSKPQTISSEVRELLDIAADEEDENGEIIKHKDLYQDEHEEKYGIAKNLLAEKSEIKFLKQHKEIYDTKRNEIHQQLINNEDEEELELMKRAFIDGECRNLQNKRRKGDIQQLFNDDNGNNDGRETLKFKSRNFELDRRNEPEYYLSDNEEKNEFCCYDENGLFYDIYTIRMKIMEWNRAHNMNDNELLLLDDEEDKETIKLRQKRVEKRETIYSNNDKTDNPNLKINDNDKNAIKLLEKLRNKKIRKKPKLIKSQTVNTINTNFKTFYLEKGLEIPSLQRSNSSSFLQHRSKCMEINNKSSSSCSAAMLSSSSSSNVVGNKRVIIFQKKSQIKKNMKKRRRDNMDGGNNNNNDNNNMYKKRRI